MCAFRSPARSGLIASRIPPGQVDLVRGVVGLWGCWVVGLLGCWGCWVVGLLGCWVAGLWGCGVVGLLGVLAHKFGQKSNLEAPKYPQIGHFGSFFDHFL